MVHTKCEYSQSNWLRGLMWLCLHCSHQLWGMMLTTSTSCLNVVLTCTIHTSYQCPVYFYPPSYGIQNWRMCNPPRRYTLFNPATPQFTLPFAHEKHCVVFTPLQCIHWINIVHIHTSRTLICIALFTPLLCVHTICTHSHWSFVQRLGWTPHSHCPVHTVWPCPDVGWQHWCNEGPFTLPTLRANCPVHLSRLFALPAFSQAIPSSSWWVSAEIYDVELIRYTSTLLRAQAGINALRKIYDGK